MDRETPEPPHSSPFRWLMPLLVVAVLVISTVIVVLALVGPTVGNVFSNISRGLSRDGGGGSYSGPGASSTPSRPVTSSSPVAAPPVNQQRLNPMKAGEIDDNAQWDTYTKFRNGYISRYGSSYIIDFDVTGRRIIKVVDAKDQPIMGAYVSVSVDNMTVSSTLTYATGMTLFFPNADERSKRRDLLQVTVTVNEYQVFETLDMRSVGDVFEVQIPLVMVQDGTTRHLAPFTPVPTMTYTAIPLPTATDTPAPNEQR